MDADGVVALSFAQAQATARDWFSESARAGNDVPASLYTVADAMRDYLNWYALHKKALDATTNVVNVHILPAFGDKEIDKLTIRGIRTWRDGIATSPPRVRSGMGKPARTREEATTA